MPPQSGPASSSPSPTGSSPCSPRATATQASTQPPQLIPGQLRTGGTPGMGWTPWAASWLLPQTQQPRTPKWISMLWSGGGPCLWTSTPMTFSTPTLGSGKATSRGVPFLLGSVPGRWLGMTALWPHARELMWSARRPVSLPALCLLCVPMAGACAFVLGMCCISSVRCCSCLQSFSPSPLPPADLLVSITMTR